MVANHRYGAVRVVYSEIPVRLYLANLAHRSRLLGAVRAAVQPPDGSAELAGLAEELTSVVARYVRVEREARSQAELSQFLGGDRFDFYVDLPPNAGEDFTEIVAAIEHLDRLRLPGVGGRDRASPAMASLRRWFAEETERQLEGQALACCPF